MGHDKLCTYNTLKLPINSGNLNLLESEGPVQACTGLPSNFVTFTWTPEQVGEDKNILPLPGFGTQRACPGLPPNFFNFYMNSWTVWKGQKYLVPTGIRAPYRTTRSLFTMLTELTDSVELTEDLQMWEVIFLSLQLLNASTCHELVPVRAQVISTSQ